MIKVAVTEAGPLLSELIDRELDGEEVILTERGKPVVKLVPIPQARPQRRMGTAKGLVRYIADDFDAPLVE